MTAVKTERKMVTDKDSGEDREEDSHSDSGEDREEDGHSQRQR